MDPNTSLPLPIGEITELMTPDTRGLWVTTDLNGVVLRYDSKRHEAEKWLHPGRKLRFEPSMKWSDTFSGSGNGYTGIAYEPTRMKVCRYRDKTKKAILDYVTNNNGCKLKDAVDNIKHHYASRATAVSSLCVSLQKKTLEGIRPEWIDKDGERENPRLWTRDC